MKITCGQIYILSISFEHQAGWHTDTILTQVCLQKNLHCFRFCTKTGQTWIGNLANRVVQIYHLINNSLRTHAFRKLRRSVINLIYDIVLMLAYYLFWLSIILFTRWFHTKLTCWWPFLIRFVASFRRSRCSDRIYGDLTSHCNT